MKTSKSRKLKTARTLLSLFWAVGLLITGIGLAMMFLFIPEMKVAGFNVILFSFGIIIMSALSVLMVPFILHLYFPNVLTKQAEFFEMRQEYNAAIHKFIEAKRKLMDQVADNIVSPQLPHIKVRREYYDKTKGTHTLRVYDENGTMTGDAGEHQPTWDITMIYKDKYILFSPGKTPVAEPSKHLIYIQLPE